MSEEKEIVIEKTDLEKEHAFFPIKELLVKDTSMLRIEITNIVSWELFICHLVFVHWKKAISCVSLHEKESLINATMDGCGIIYNLKKYEKSEETHKKIRKSVDSLILQGGFKEEIENRRKWLIPLKPLLECATPQNTTKPGSWCFVHTYNDVNISLT